MQVNTNYASPAYVTAQKLKSPTTPIAAQTPKSSTSDTVSLSTQLRDKISAVQNRAINKPHVSSQMNEGLNSLEAATIKALGYLSPQIAITVEDIKTANSTS